MLCLAPDVHGATYGYVNELDVYGLVAAKLRPDPNPLLKGGDLVSYPQDRLELQLTHHQRQLVPRVQAIFAGRFRCATVDRWGWLARAWPSIAWVPRRRLEATCPQRPPSTTLDRSAPTCE
jgi:hypothetical protein